MATNKLQLHQVYYFVTIICTGNINYLFDNRRSGVV